ncbi:MAG: hypothetical protein AMJ38_02070, partial [Dehalococcoidia bacterium DG_22]
MSDSKEVQPRRSDVSGPRRPRALRWLGWGILVSALAMLALTASMISASPNGRYLADPNFQIDGDTVAGKAVGTAPPEDPLAGDDWVDVILDGADWDTGPGILIQDPHGKVETDPDIFKPAGKFAEPEKWSIQSGGVGAAQSELTNVGIYALKPGDISNTDSWMIMMMERTKEQGTFDLDFELNQVPWDGTSGTLVRTPGDVVAAFELKGRPTDPQADLEVVILVYDPDRNLNVVGDPLVPDSEERCSATISHGKVVAVVEGSGSCPDYDPGDPTGFVYRFRGPATALGSFGRATMNGLDFDAPPWGSLDSQGKSRLTIPAFHFAEAAINLTELGIEPGCPGFGSVHAKTRSSLEADSDLKDLAGPRDLPIECAIYGRKFED